MLNLHRIALNRQLKKANDIREVHCALIVILRLNKLPQLQVICYAPTCTIITESISTEVRNVMVSLKNSSSGHDEFPLFVGKSCVDAYIELLTHLINVSLKSGVFLSELRLAKVVPIFKAGDTSGINNYKPISVL